MPHALKRLTLITGIFTVGSLLLSCLSGTIGWFGTYWAVACAIAAGCFFLLIAYSTGLSLLHSRKDQDASYSKYRPSAIFAVVALIAAHLFTLSYNSSPSENLLGNHDQGMYLAAASHLKMEGSHAMLTDWIRQSPVEYKRFLTKEISPSLKTESPSEKTNTGTQAGFYLMDDVGSSQYIQFPPGYPTLLAIFWSLGEYGLVVHSNGILCLVCGLMLVAVCRNFIGRTGALATWLLFLFCPLTLWSANHLYAEPALLLLWLIALWALSCSKEHRVLSAILASLSIGVAFLVKIDALPLFILPLAYAAFVCNDNSLRFRASFLILSIVASLLATGFYLHYSKPYFDFTLSGVFSGRLFLVIAFTALIVATASSIPKIRARVYGWIKANSQLLRYSLAVLTGLILIDFYCVLSHVAEPHRVFSDESGKGIESLREQTFYRLGWYLTPPGLALASAGLIAALIKRIHPVRLAFTGIATLFLLYYSYDIHCTPYQPYAMRRLFPFVVPALCFGIPFLIQSLPVKLCSPKMRGLIILLITAILVPQFQQINQKLIIREDYKGLYQHLSTVSQELPEDERILINGKGKAYIYAASLRYIFERECILVYPDYRDRKYHELMDYLTDNGNQPIYMLSTFPNDRMNLQAKVLSTQKLADTLHTTYSGTGTTDYPDDDIKPFKLSLYLTKLEIP